MVVVKSNMVLADAAEAAGSCCLQQNRMFQCMAVLLAVVVAGPIMFFTGIAFMAHSTTNVRENNIKAFNHQVSRSRPRFFLSNRKS